MSEIKIVRCDKCNCFADVEDTFIFEDTRYCQLCLYDLILDMADSGNVNLDMNNIEDNGIVVRF